MRRYPSRIKPIALAVGVALSSTSVLAPSLALAEQLDGRTERRRESSQRFDIPAGSLARALNRLATRAGLALSYDPALTAGKTTGGLRGEHTPAEALQRLLAGTGLSYRFTGAETVTLAESPGQDGNEALELDPIQVEGALNPRPSEPAPVEGYRADYAASLTRLPTVIEEIPAAIGVVTSDFIEDTGATGRDQALEQIAGVSRGGSIRGEQGVTIRGFNRPEAARELNGLSLRDARPLDPAVIERIEVTRGPSSIINGAASPGGSFDVITKGPRAEPFAVLVQEIGAYGRFRSVADLNGPLSASGEIRGRVVASGVPDDGSFVDDTESREITLAPSLELDLFRGSGTARLTYLRQDFDGNTFRGVPLMASGGAPDIDPETNVGGGDDNGAFNEMESDSVQLQYDHEFANGLALTGRVGYQESDQELADVYAFQFRGGIPASGDINIYASRRTLDKESLAGELFFSRSFELGAGRHDLVFGADYRDQTRDAFLAFAGPSQDNIFDLENEFSVPASGFTPFTDRTFELEQTGVFGQVAIRPLPGLTLSGGVRYDDVTFSNRARVRGVDAEVDDGDTTARGGLSYELFRGLRIYGSYQESFNVQSALQASGVLVPPETGDSIEAGAKLALLDGRLAASAAVFRTDRENVASPDPLNPGFSIVTGEQRHEGVELQLDGELTPGLRISAQLSWLDAEITSAADFEGNAPPGVPDSYVGRVFALYRPDGGLLQGWSLGGGVFFHSGFVIDSANEFETDGYERVDLVAAYRWSEQWQFQLNVRNVTDAEYIENPGTSSANNQFGAPLNVLGSIRFRF